MSLAEQRHWPGLSILDVLRPGVGQVAEFALIATYSVDLVAVVASMLALAGQDDEDGSGSKVAFAQAFEALRDRFRVICQAGRTITPNKSPEVLALLDHFVREVKVDEQIASWHPKAALIKFTSADPLDELTNDEWRLWIGSRNLTKTSAWEAGLVLVGSENGPGTSVAGISQLGARLAKYAELPDISDLLLMKLLDDVCWRSPDGVVVRRIDLYEPSESRAWPVPPQNLSSLTVVSPFLDSQAVSRLGRWGNEDTDRRLLSTLPELAAIKGQKQHFTGFSDLLILDGPDTSDVFGNRESSAEETESVDGVLPDRGLHAKLILAETVNDSILYIGSANASRRGLSGGNAEVIAQLEVDDDICAGLNAFVDQIAHLITLDDVPEGLDEDEDTDISESLEAARKQVAARWSAKQRVYDDRIVMLADSLPHPDDAEISMAVSLFPGGAWTCWPRQSELLELQKIRQFIPSEFVGIRLELAGRTVTWLQRAHLEPPRSYETDIALLARHMDVRTFLQWVRALLYGYSPGDGGGPWDEVRPTPKRNKGNRHEILYWAPTVEDVLRAWSRNPDSVAETDRRIRRYLEYVEAREDKDEETQRILADFKSTWNVITQVLG